MCNVTAGDAYFIPPGHTVLMEAGAEIVEFSPKAKYQKTLEVISRNLTKAAYDFLNGFPAKELGVNMRDSSPS